jgi:hypothetical protein
MQQLLLQMCELVLTAHESVPKPFPDFMVFGVPELVFDLGSPSLADPAFAQNET